MRDVALLRHGYVLPDSQRTGIGARLMEHLEREGRGAAGYRPSSDPEKVLRAYYSIPEARLRSSITYEKPLWHDRP